MKNIIEKEQKACFDFFWNEVSLSDEVYGLIRDNTKNKNMCSIASIGFGLPAIVVGVERGYNSVKATLAARQYCIDNAHIHKRMVKTHGD